MAVKSGANKNIKKSQKEKSNIKYKLMTRIKTKTFSTFIKLRMYHLLIIKTDTYQFIIIVYGNN